MVCLFDRAQRLEQRQREQAIAAQLACALPSGPSLTHCKECDMPIPDDRRALGGITHCVPCKSRIEQGQRR